MVPKIQITLITSFAKMHFFVCKIGTNMCVSHKFALQGPLVEQIRKHKTHLHIISMFLPSLPCLEAWVHERQATSSS